ncbi:MAG: hypothetical protein ACOCQ6_00615, partial [Bacteroidota bacterium]
GHTDFQSVALPTELWYLLRICAGKGIKIIFCASKNRTNFNVQAEYFAVLNSVKIVLPINQSVNFAL